MVTGRADAVSLNTGGAGFNDVTAKAGWRLALGRAAFFDYDRDGRLDLAQILPRVRSGDGAAARGGCTWKGFPVMCGPGSCPCDQLYRNVGDWTQGEGAFSDVTLAAGFNRAGGIPGRDQHRLRLDDADLYVANDHASCGRTRATARSGGRPNAA